MASPTTSSNEIERVIFAAWPAAERQGATSFAELLQIHVEDIRSRQRAHSESIAALSEQITDLWVVRAGGPQAKTRRTEAERFIGSLEAQMRELTSDASGAQHGERLALISDVLGQRQAQLQDVARRITDLGNLAGEVERLREDTFPNISSRLRDAHPRTGLGDEQWAAFAVDFLGDVQGTIHQARGAAEAEHGRLQGVPETQPEMPALDSLDRNQLSSLTVSRLGAEQVRLQKLVGLDENRRRRLTGLDEQLQVARGKLAQAQRAMDAAEVAPAALSTLGDRRLKHYAAYFDALLEEEEKLNALYAPLRGLMEEFGASVAKLQFSVRRAVNLTAWAEVGESLLDTRKAGPFRGLGELARVANTELLPAWSTGDGAAAAQAVRAFTQRHSDDLRAQARASRENDAGYRRWEQEVARWLYSADHVSLQYTLEYSGLNIRSLSPGSRGIVLLLLYLAVDREEFDPLIIDQPEENLDPESVYSELVQLFRAASDRRQIIMVTHNANLVVNTDVDQVIVAHVGRLQEGRLPELSYKAGGLECAEIRRAVCEVLEGGAEAFRQRARRLRIELPDS